MCKLREPGVPNGFGLLTQLMICVHSARFSVRLCVCVCQPHPDRVRVLGDGTDRLGSIAPYEHIGCLRNFR